MEEVERRVFAAWDLVIEGTKKKGKPAVALCHQLSQGERAKDGVLEWLILAPAPHSCLSFLDVEGEADHEDPQLKTKKKVAIFSALCPFLTDVPTIKRAQVASATAERFLLRLHRARTGTHGLSQKSIKCMLSFLRLSVQINVGFEKAVYQVLQTGHALAQLEVLQSEAKLRPLYIRDPIYRLASSSDDHLRRAAISAIPRYLRILDDPRSTQLLLDVCTHEANSQVRAAAYLSLDPFMFSHSPEQALRVIHAGMQDRDQSIASAATTAIQAFLEKKYNPGEISRMMRGLVETLSGNLRMKNMKLHSLVELCIDVALPHLFAAQSQLELLPEELQLLALKRGQVDQDQEDGHRVRFASESCILKLVQRLPNSVPQFIEQVRVQLDQDDWLARESGLYMLGILAAKLPISLVWQYLPIITTCLSHQEYRMRITGWWTLARCLERFDPDRILSELDALPQGVLQIIPAALNQEPHPHVIETALCELSGLVRGGLYRDFSESMTEQLFDACLQLCHRSNVMGDRLRPLALELIGQLFYQAANTVNPGEALLTVAPRAIATVAEELRSEERISSATYVPQVLVRHGGQVSLFGLCQTVRDQIKALPTLLDKEHRRRVERLARKRRSVSSFDNESYLRLERSLELKEEKRRTERSNVYASLGECFEMVGLIMDTSASHADTSDLNVGSWIYDVLQAIVCVLQAAAFKYSDDALIQSVGLLGDLAIHASDDLARACFSKELSSSLFLALSDILARSTTTQLKEQIINTIGTFILHTPGLIEPQWLSSLNPALWAPSRGTLRMRQATHGMLSLLISSFSSRTSDGWEHVHKAITGLVVHLILNDHVPFPSKREKQEDMIELIKLVMDHMLAPESQPEAERVGMKASLDLVRMLTNCDVLYGDVYDEEQASVEDQMQQLLRGLLLRAFGGLEDEVFVRSYLSRISREGMERVVDVLERLLPEDHTLVVAAREYRSLTRLEL